MQGLLRALVGSVALLLAAGPASAQEPSDRDDVRARERFDEGTRHYNERRYLEAARTYEEAYALSPRPLILLNVSTAYERALEMGRAADALEQYLGVADDIEDEAEMRERLERLRALARADAPPTVSPPTSSPNDPTSPSPTPSVAPPHALAPAPPSPWFTPRPLVGWTATSSPRGRPPTITAEPSGWAVLGGVSAALAGIAGVTSFAMGGLALDAADQLGRECPGGLCPRTSERTYQDAVTFTTAGNVAGPLALGFAAVTALAVVLDQLDGEDDAEADEGTVSVVPAGLRVAFR